MNMTRALLLAFISILGAGCAGKYTNWEYVRIEYEVPSKKCEYKIQEACYSVGAKCFNWYKKRATIYGANTVVLTERESGQRDKSSIIAINGNTGGSSVSDPTITALADYYFCPNNKPR